MRVPVQFSYSNQRFRMSCWKNVNIVLKKVDNIVLYKAEYSKSLIHLWIYPPGDLRIRRVDPRVFENNRENSTGTTLGEFCELIATTIILSYESLTLMSNYIPTRINFVYL